MSFTRIPAVKLKHHKWSLCLLLCACSSAFANGLYGPNNPAFDTQFNDFYTSHDTPDTQSRNWGMSNRTRYCIDPNRLASCVDAAKKEGSVATLVGQTYYLKEPLLLESGVKIAGQGSSSVITWHDSIKDSVDKPLLTSKWKVPVENVSLEGFALKCHIDQDSESSDFRNNHMGLYLNGPGDPTKNQNTVIKNLSLKKLTVYNCSHGIHVKGATGVFASDLNLHHNGNTHKDYFHNVYWRRVADLFVSQADGSANGYWGSPRGHGIRGSHLINVYFENLDVHDNADHGVHLDHIINMRLHNMHINDNCKEPNGGCNAIKCYSKKCDIEWRAPKEKISRQ